ncbi:MAG: hypothetical protein BV456_00890 [Thermoplasmata archaeon M8B2D]|nr:MAG: hypothetical protein BV456_00890 [Thermoplasmata archaeon M8B2D]
MKKDRLTEEKLKTLIMTILSISSILFIIKFNRYFFSGWIVFVAGMTFGLVSTLIEKSINSKK